MLKYFEGEALGIECGVWGMDALIFVPTNTRYSVFER
ncbi:protein of unknown function [Mesotoga infera]|uniref:Uncharacterized protein n=1 Tax=Mesotoga infera TaxID=1236046 RepID=A0A7Z7LHK4_9BACT|nr:protein of unknown function [Mesotoga infera]